MRCYLSNDALKLFRNLIIFNIFALLAVICGCMGISHVKVSIPPFDVVGKISDVADGLYSDSVYIINPEFYGESAAFISLVKNRLSNDSLYQWRRVDITRKRIISAKFDRESRFIGFMAPFSPSKKTLKSRTIFVWMNNSQTIYRITIHGNKSTVEKANVSEVRNSLPVSLFANIGSNLNYSREQEIKKEKEFYRKVKWEKTDEIRIIEIARSNSLDSLRFALYENSSN